MQVKEYLRTYGIEKLKEEFAIKVKEYPERRMLVLNYNQIDSPKTHPIVMECRGLILDMDSFTVVSRTFDRFFNLGEALDTAPKIDWEDSYVMEKVDGSLIAVYFDERNFRWEIATRGTAFAEAETAWDITFRELFLRTLDMEENEFQWKASNHLDTNQTYIFELTTMENRVVTKYDQDYVWFLGSRDKYNARFTTPNEDWFVSDFSEKVKFPNTFHFKSDEDAVNSASKLPDLQEGYVVYNFRNRPVSKIKSPSYVAVHRIKGEGLTPKRIMELVVTGEKDEYLTYFPEDHQKIMPYSFDHEMMLQEMERLYEDVKEIESQKEFALSVKDYSYSSVLFSTRQLDCDPYDVYSSLEVHRKMKIFESYLSEFK